MTKKTRWKQFWEDIGYSVQKINRHLKGFNSRNKLRRFNRLYNCNDATIAKIYNKFGKFKTTKDKINFIFFDKFASTHSEAIKLHYKSEMNVALLKLLRGFPKNKEKFIEIRYYNQWLRVGRGINYKFTSSRSSDSLIRILKAVKFASGSFYSPKIGYHELSKCRFDDTFLIVIRKGTKKNQKLLYVAIAFKEKKFFFSPTFTNFERYVIIKKLGRAGLPIIVDPHNNDFSTLIKFIKSDAEIAGSLELAGIEFEESGIAHRIRGMWGRPSEKNLSSEIKKELPVNFGIAHLLQVYLYITKNDGGQKTYYFEIKKFKGLLCVSLNSARLNKTEYDEILKIFNTQFGFEADENYYDPMQDENYWYKLFLDERSKTKYPGIGLPPLAVEAYSKLQKEGILKDNDSSYAWTCLTKGCVNYGTRLWSKTGGSCANCNTNFKKTKDVVIFVKDEKRIPHFLAKIAKNEGFTIEVHQKQVLKKKIPIVKAINEKGEILSIAVAYTRNDLPYIDELCRRCTNLMVVSAGVNLKSIEQPIFKTSISEIFLPYLKQEKTDFISKGLSDQLSKWDERRIVAGNQSENFLNILHLADKNPSKYTSLSFELDTFNLMHAIFSNSAWLGAKVSGEKLPDGAAHLEKEGCIIWDCKLSFALKGANVGAYKKNKTYVEFVGKLPFIKKMGGLKSYIIITNNEQQGNYVKLFKKIKQHIKEFDKVNYILLNSRYLVRIYSELKKHKELITSDSSVAQKVSELINKFFIGINVSVIYKAEIDNLISEINLVASKPIISKLESEKFTI